MNLRSLKIFKEVCETKNMTEAGKRLYMTQPAVSQGISNLEKELGVKLFERMKNRLELTYSGRVLYNYSKKILRMVEESEDFLGQIAELKKGKLRIGASMTIGTYLLPKIINEFKEEHEELKMPLLINNTDYIVEKILNNELDIGFIEGPFTAREITDKFFIKDELSLIASPQYFNKPVEEISLDDLNGEKFIMREEGSGTRDIAKSKLEELKIDFKIKHVLNNFEAIKKALMANMGISILPKLSVKEELERGQLIKIKVKGLGITRDFRIIYHNEKFQSPFFTHFLDFLNKYS
ncbi:MAG: LysR substrate-binding domain-containing protein [Halanaerobiales bacterium]